jgi:cytochrome c
MDMKRIALVIIAGAALAVAGPSLASEDLAKKSGCLNCHNVSGAKKMAPALKGYAGKGEEAILAGLNDKKKHGAVKAGDDDKKALAKWVASLK